MTAQDQQVFTTLKQYGLSTDMNSQEAGQIRQNLQGEQLRDDIKSFASDFSNGVLQNGGKIGEALVQSIQRPILGPQVNFKLEWSRAA
jgi:hypothetical protein